MIYGTKVPREEVEERIRREVFYSVQDYEQGGFHERQ